MRERVSSLLATLREATCTVDAMWREAVEHRDAGRLVEFGDASHGLHLALVALDDGEAERRTVVA
ncbi:MAG TPA: hypothetical protein VFA84_12230 [Acidimicrobiales bacterium]|nr:hypothetical protein [Acidimicrobiales bacterium]